MSADANKAVIGDLFAAVNAGDPEQMLALIGDGIVVHTAVPGIAPGREGFRAFMGVYFTAFPVQRVEVQALVADGELVSVLHTHHATNLGPFAGMPPTGREVTIEGLELFRVRDGKVVEMWHHDDLFGLMQQLGAISGPDGGVG
jgi:steroid delta-isomerase-like uncharacterized protein